MNKHEECSFSNFVFKFKKDLNLGDSYSCKFLGIKPFIFYYLSPIIYNPTTFSPTIKAIFEMEGKLMKKMINPPEHAQDISIPSYLPEWEGLENQKYIYYILSKIKKPPSGAKTLLLEKKINGYR
jgi:hypothetical protein